MCWAESTRWVFSQPSDMPAVIAPMTITKFKAVSDNYPLRGRVRLGGAPGQPDEELAAAPEPGTAWVDPAVLEALKLAPGQPLLLGEARLRIARAASAPPWPS